MAITKRDTKTSLFDRTKLKVVKDAELVQKGSRLSVRSALFIHFLIAKIDSVNQKKIEEQEFTYKEITEILNFDGVRRVSQRQDVEKIMDELNVNKLVWNQFDENNELDKINLITWIEKLSYSPKKDTFSFKITESLHDYLLDIGALDPKTNKRRPFISYKWVLITTFKSPHTLNFYEEIERRIHNNKSLIFSISVESLKYLCGIAGKYHKFYEFKRWVLEPVKKDLDSSEFSSYGFTYEVDKKERKKVISLTFHVYTKERKRLPEARPEEGLYMKIDDMTKNWSVQPNKVQIDELTGRGVSVSAIIKAAQATQNLIDQNGGEDFIKTNVIAYFIGMTSKTSQQGEMFVDPIQEKKESQRNKKVRIAERDNKQKELKNKIEKLEKKRNKQGQLIKQEIIKTERETVLKILRDTEDRNPSIGRYKTDKEKLSSAVVWGYMYPAIKAKFPEKYKEYENLGQQIEKLKEAI